jgi:hypothetical protein
MKKLILVMLLITISGYSQIKLDSLSISKDSVINTKVKSSWYVRSMFVSLMSAGQLGETLSERITQNIEFGKSIGMVDVGLAIGKAKLINYSSDSYLVDNSIITQYQDHNENKLYIQGRLTMDACQYGIFSNEISIGAGYTFSKTMPIMLEISSTIFAQVGDNWGLGIIIGTYNFTGDNDDLNKSFTGLFLRYGLIRDDGGILLNRTRVTRSKRPIHNKVK